MTFHACIEGEGLGSCEFRTAFGSNVLPRRYIHKVDLDFDNLPATTTIQLP
jgi:hypothetical protein